MRWWEARILCDGIFTMPYTDGKSKHLTSLTVGYKFQAKNRKEKALKKARRLMETRVKNYFEYDKIVKIFWHTIKVKALFKKDYPQEGEFIYFIEKRYYRFQ